ncbi:DEAD/DEAH box helicase [Flavobacterium muglaense]|uniref:DEAD/DEAH box helicase family protein n=1 Tax=Flavobacterium muglaense TaxID=2764716 RepID=A0A923N123_9FLAO|nr:DEAD/DEAH box helicase [Flavobacterium muglaense]MBC5837634.1 DEAD/DEAH box helicase family protein [Flavobacterium muglaense]MBC5844160.1 DEAD/DEAH box helicase family protein [Flavobacterium muglaense]
MPLSSTNDIQLFKSVFAGREDVFAVRWEKGSKSGYMPAYFYDPYRYRAHKMNGGTFQNYADKEYLTFTDKEIEKHLNGEQHIGIYPLLKDNTSWFIVADFDKVDWLEDCKKFINTCTQKGIPAYLERSRSGKGGHVWIFFEQPYPAIKSRKIFISILEQTGVFSLFDKSSSFDRMFPNQDFLSGKGFGNLIALPLYKKTFEQGNSCFIDIESLEPIPNQWDFIKNIQKISTIKLDELYQIHYTQQNSIASIVPKLYNEKLTIRLANVVKINRNAIPTPLINFLKEELNFINTHFLIKKKMGKSTFGTERYFKLVEETENEVIIPRGFTGKIIRFCRANNIEYDFKDERKKSKEVSFLFNAQLREHQQIVIDTIAKKDLGVIVAPPGSGKTIVGLKIIAEKKQPALIITHRKQIADQWIERIETFLGIPKNEIGKIGQGKTKIGKQITVAMIQSLSKELEKPDGEKLLNAFGTIILDECHHIPAETFRNTISKLQTFYLYGLTATPFRKYNDSKLIFIHLGDMIAEIKSDEISTSKKPKIIIRNTDLDVPFNSKTDKFETLSKILVHDSTRNKAILEDVINELKSLKKVIIITERKEHIDSLYQYLKQSYEIITLSGEDSESSKNSKWKLLKEGNYQVVITTGQFFGEGTDLQNANCLFLVYPFSFEGKLIQYIGRVQRSEITPTIYDYRDIKIDYLNKMFLKRNVYYRKIDKQATLFDEPEEDIIVPKNNFSIDKKVKIPFEKLEFRYGSISFKYEVPEMKTELEFDIENYEIRPEFEVLKTYFFKTLKVRNITVTIHAEFENGILISQLALSNDLEKITEELIESVKFKFIAKTYLGKPNTIGKENLLDINQLQNEKYAKLYDSGDELLNDFLQNQNYKHQTHLQYLANNHERTILKIRFVLNPFSFVFLLAGKTGFHIVLETLNTEEATYIWHFDNDKKSLPDKLKQVDNYLNTIRNDGRQSFIENPPDNFSRILHDYSTDRKGFVIWKDLIEERLT